MVGTNSAKLATAGICLALAAWSLSCSGGDDAVPGDHATARGAEAREKPFVASARREVFHRADCRWAKRISEGNLLGYDRREDAIADGYRPCAVCRP